MFFFSRFTGRIKITESYNGGGKQVRKPLSLIATTIQGRSEIFFLNNLDFVIFYVLNLSSRVQHEELKSLNEVFMLQ